MKKDVQLVIGFGAGGGLVSWAFTLMTGATFGLNQWGALLLCIILGIASALVAIYVIVPTDVSRSGKLMAFALLCGFLWKPVLDAGRVLVSQRIEAAVKSAELRLHLSQQKETSAESNSNSTARIGTKAHEIGDSAAELLRITDQIGNKRLEDNAKDQTKEAIRIITDSSQENPYAATLALSEIKSAAEGSNQKDLAKSATESIDSIVEKFPDSTAIPPG